jgi:hypothetical protein
MVEPEQYITDLSKAFPKLKILLSGSQLAAITKKLPGNIQLFRTPEDFLKLI